VPAMFLRTHVEMILTLPKRASSIASSARVSAVRHDREVLACATTTDATRMQAAIRYFPTVHTPSLVRHTQVLIAKGKRHRPYSELDRHSDRDVERSASGRLAEKQVAT